MEKTFNPKNIENNWYMQWEQKNYFAPADQGDPYCIMIPPPNVTGSLHMGHAFQHAIMDALVRYQRMKGKKTLWQVGTDHAGIATQMLVERKLAEEKQPSRHELGRELFLEKVQEWKEQSGGRITQQMRRLGNSVDWQHESFTMDAAFCRAVQQAFITLYKDGLIYRGKRLVNWDPALNTAISDLEVENKLVNGSMWYVRYPLLGDVKTLDNKSYIVIATTRPETIFGDVAVAVHPKDERYQHLIGEKVFIPIANRAIPIIADHYADMEKGSGCVKITPAHDFNDAEVGTRCQLPAINILTKSGHIVKKGDYFSADGRYDATHSVSIPKAYQNLDRFAARLQLVEDLSKEGVLEKVVDHELTIPYGDRSGVIIEPILTDQWFVCSKKLAKPAQDAVTSGRIKFVPEQYNNMYNSWLTDIQDWCISRQLWWGHRIPVWYDDLDNIYVGENEDAIRSHYQLEDTIKLHQDPDVLDTWFSASLWTFATLGWPDKTVRLQDFHPTDVLVTGFDIIFFWVTRMIMMTLYLIKDEAGQPSIPFRHVYITGLIRDEQGQKMSKSKGNVLDPLDMINGIDLESLIKKRTGHLMQPKMAARIAKNTRKAFPNGIEGYGTDALRFTLYSLATTGRDIHWDMKRLEGYRHFCTKIWNAAQYVLMHKPQQVINAQVINTPQGVINCWIVSCLQRTLSRVEKNIALFRLDHAVKNLYDFVWND